MEVLTIVPFGGGGGGGDASVAGSDTQIQYNDGGSLGASADLTWDDTAKELGVGGDINLDDGGTYSTTLQMVTATANRTISFPDATGTVALVSGSNGTVQYNEGGVLKGNSDFTVDLDWNDASTVFTGLKLNVTDTASAAGSNLLDLQVGGTSQLSIGPNGSLNGPATFLYNTSGSHRFNTSSAAGPFFIQSNQVRIANFGITFCSQTNYNNPEFSLLRDAANTLAQRNDTNAQTFRLYNTYTDASNYERGFFRWNSDVLEIGSESDGTGTSRLVKIVTNNSFNIQAGGTNQKLFAGSLERNSSSNHITWSNSVNALTGITSDIGIKRDQANVLAVTDGSTGTGYIKQVPVAVSALPAAATVGAGTRGFVNDANATTFASVVVGGGANVVPVYSDGTDWRIG